MTVIASVKLASGIEYVSGTINGTPAVWTLENGRWQAATERSEDGRYAVEIAAIDSAGNRTEMSFSLFDGIGSLKLITDRTQEDDHRVEEIERKIKAKTATAAEVEEYLAGMRGAYNTTDLNRVGNAVRYVADRFEEAGYPVQVSPRTDWAMEEIPGPAEMEAYLGDIATLRGRIATLPTTPPVPQDMEDLTWQEANDIEQILKDIDFLIGNMMEAWYYSGELYAGEV